MSASPLNIISEMDLISNLVPAVPPLLDPTNPLHNVTLLQNTFMSAFLGTFLANLGAQTVRHILGESVRLTYSTQPSFVINEKAKTNLK